MKRTWMIPLTVSALALAACADKPANDASTTNTTSARYPDGTMSSNVNDTSATGAATNMSPDPTLSHANTNPNGAASTQDGSSSGWNTSPTNGTQQTWNGNGSSGAGSSNAGATRTGTRSDTAVPSHDTNLSDASSTNGTYGNAAGASGGAQHQPGATTPSAPQNGNGGVTPIDQGNGQSDLKMTQAIRKEVVANGDLSFTAKNVKIITKNGHVTLKGEVKSQKERDEIEGTAKRVAGAANVDDQVVVKP